MKWIRKRQSSLSVIHKIMLTYVVLIVGIVGISTSYSLLSSINELNREIDQNIADFSYLLSMDERIRAMLEQPDLDPDPGTVFYLDQMLRRLDKVDIIVVADNQAVRRYHPEKERVGERFAGGDEGAALQGEPPYLADGVGTRQFQRRSFAPVKAADGMVLGFVMVSAYKASIQAMRVHTILKGLPFFSLSLLMAFWLAGLLSQSIKKSLLGYEPAQIAKLYRQWGEVLDTLEEGILAVDQQGGSMLINGSARKLLSVQDDTESIEEAIRDFISRHLETVIRTGTAEYHCELELNGCAILADKIPIIEYGKQVGVACLLKNKTEFQSLAEQLTGVNHIVAALRANTHEYINKLHVILGLLQIGDSASAMDYIEQVKKEEQQDSSLVMNRIENRTIAALIMGKKKRAKERDMELVLRKDSHLEAHNDYLPVSELVTIVGNLLENAMDATADSKTDREIILFIRSSKCGLTIQVDDTGSGMSKEQIEKLKTESFSTKGEGRGIGMKLVRKIVDCREGILEIESEPGEGTSFIISIDKKRRRLANGGRSDSDSNRGR